MDGSFIKYYEKKCMSDPSEAYAAPVMLDACHCPHLDAVLPTLLQVEGCGLFAKSGHIMGSRHSSNLSSISLIHNLHVKAVSNPHTSSPARSSAMSYPWGKEQFKFDVVASGGLSDYYCPLIPPRYTQRLESRDYHRKRPLAYQDQKGTTCSDSQDRDRLKLLQNKLYKMKRRLVATTDTTTSPKEVKNRTVSNSLGTVKSHKQNSTPEETDSVQSQMIRIKTSTQVEFWMQVLKENRIRYWKNQQYIRHTNKERSQSKSVVESPASCSWSNISCRWCTPTNKDVSYMQSDAWMQCLDCSVIACGPQAMDTKAPFLSQTREHIRQHFLLSGHNFGITCGPLAAVYCMSCGDFIYHEAFQSEIQRIAIRCNATHLGWERNRTIIRSFQCMDFIVSPDPLFSPPPTEEEESMERGQPDMDGTVVWRGLRAAYPSAESRDLEVATSLTFLRMQIFQGDLNIHHYLTLDSKALSMAPVQNYSKLVQKIQAPLGIYNLGNSCFFNSVIQCLIHCRPLQRFFLVDVKHNYMACPHLRRSHTTTDYKLHSMCLGCEMDKIILMVYSGVNGVDVRRILEDAVYAPSQPRAPANPELSIRGTPMVLSDMLIAVRKCRSMSRLKGHDQHDAHEFLQEFLDSLGKHCRNHTKQLNKLREEASSCSFETILNDTVVPMNSRDLDVSKYIFGGELRSLLICGICGHKRTQTEPYLNISLPLAKEISLMPRDDTTKQLSNPTIPLRSKLDLLSCLKHFTIPESLIDPVYCEDCGMKTPTWKQHTFAKLPQVLCFHLKRFDFLKKKKITEPVGFPVSFNMGSFLPGWSEVIQGDTRSLSDAATKSEGHDDSEFLDAAPLLMYDLYATIDHYGSLNQGHYVTNVKVNDKWYNCNDSFVSHIDEAIVLKSESAYMLFYSRRMM